LKLLQTSYFGKVKMIYIDPPYNTGSDFVYADDFKDPLERYREVTKQTTKSNPESMGRFHTNWLNMMWPRLRLAANLLRDDGVIFISIDDNEVRNLRIICDEIFGEENFVAQLIWERAFSPKNDAKYVSNSHDYIICYAKHLESFEIGKLARSEEVNARYKNPDNDPKGAWLSGDLTAKTYSATYDYPIETPSGKIVNPTSGRSWNTSKEKMQQLIAENRIWFGEKGENTPRFKRYLSEMTDGMVPTSILHHKDVGHNQEGRQEVKDLFSRQGYFDNPKPVRLLKRLIEIANTKENDIILDFFSGSATTAHAVMQLNAEDGGNRRFILVQLPELTPENSEANKAGYINICEIGKERIRRAGNKIKDENGLTATGLDTGFRVFKLDSSNLKTWDDTAILGENRVEFMQERIRNMLEILKDGRTDEDVVYEVMLRLGQDLCEPISAIELPRNRRVYGVGAEIDFIVCIAFDITPEDAEIMADYAPGRIIFADRCFNNSTDKSNVKLTLRDKGITIKVL
jgi:adenine-specific DNA-methyltransferase